MSISIVRTVAGLREQINEWRHAGYRLGLVPTMGALHEGHLSLVRLAKEHADKTVVTLFVNPKQFNRPDDLAAYPRSEADDAGKLAGVGADLLFAPEPEEMYPEGFSTTVSVAGVSEGLCGAFRPGHFDGVATVVAKLLLQSQPDVAVFGEKDFQQLAVIRRLVADLNIPVSIVGGATVREDDGLAMSSRNLRLTANGRTIASRLSDALFGAAQQISSGEGPDAAIARAKAEILAAGFSEVEYLELRDAGTLAPVTRPGRPARLLAAAWLDGVRLIDNVPVGYSSGVPR
ncbi:pantoate--beta-alanine ligase [Pelagibacterium xiamenense]|uniref:pantoate--beta-alanine ligase n=1 Tax=Pelagibacterium xiamenense TaxID=2901140 RepID=UPI001E4E12D9|nr:pantoate--beta-alanine ligase [Pelagibacterium xiamenense]MCD7059838.1 pantoate--beta-alanine ligase [Pelagibacterium xiamenense]